MLVTKSVTKRQVLTKPSINIFCERKHASEFQKVFRDYLANPKTKTPVRDRMEVTLQLAKTEQELGNTAESEKLLNECESWILSHGKQEELALMYNIRANLCLIHTHYEEGMTWSLKAVQLFGQLGIHYYLMASLKSSAHNCNQMGLTDEGMEYMKQAHKVATEQLKDARQGIMCLLNINELMLDNADPGLLMKNVHALLTQIHQVYGTDASFPLATTYLHAAYISLKTGDIEQAGNYAALCAQSAARLSHIPPHHIIYMNLYSVKTEICAALGDEEGTLLNAEECIARAKKNKSVGSEMDALLHIFKFYIGQKNTTAAKKYLDMAMGLHPHRDGLLFQRLTEGQYLYYHAIGHADNEIIHFKQMNEYKMRSQQEAMTNRIKYMAAVHELEMRQKELELQKKELDFKTQELNMTTYYLQQRNQLLIDLQERINELKKNKSKADVIIKDVTKQIKLASSKEEGEKMRFREKFDETQREFISRLHKAYPSLSSSECRICALLRSGFNTKEIANLLSSSSRTIENHRASIRRKLNLGREDSLNLILAGIK